MRPLISYDDITPPQLAATNSQPPPLRQPPPKRRKMAPSQRQGGNGGLQNSSTYPAQHWDDPGSQAPRMPYDDVTAAPALPLNDPGHTEQQEQEEMGEEEEEESRELTHAEIWDDSALVDAWNSANAEYEVFHGPGKKWKEEKVKRSPLWYNVPPSTTAAHSKTISNPQDIAIQNGATSTGQDDDSRPLNFDTFIPTHDPSLVSSAMTHLDSGPSSLPGSVPALAGPSGVAIGPEAAMISQDEAFSNAMTAMYWSGYWTAVYHCRRNEATTTGKTDDDDLEEDDHEREDDNEDEDMLPAQR